MWPVMREIERKSMTEKAWKKNVTEKAWKKNVTEKVFPKVKSCLVHYLLQFSAVVQIMHFFGAILDKFTLNLVLI